MNKWLETRINDLKKAGQKKSKAGLARHLKVDNARVHEIVSGKRQIQAEEVRPMAAYLEWPEQTIWDRINKKRPGIIDVPVINYVGAGSEVYPIDDYPKGEGARTVPCPRGLDPAKTLALEVRGNSQEPTIPEGWLVYFSREPEQDIYGVVGKLCVVKVAEGPMMLKLVKRGTTPGKFNLLSNNAAMMEDVMLDWASPVRAMTAPEGT